MYKNPAVRVPFYGDLHQSVKDDIRSLFVRVRALFPKRLQLYFEVTGSWVRGFANIHSDLDVQIAVDTEDERLRVVQFINSNVPAMTQMFSILSELFATYGLRVELRTQVVLTNKGSSRLRCYRILEDEWYGLNIAGSEKRWGYNWTTREWFERPITRVVRTGISKAVVVVTDTGEAVPTGEYALGVDPFADELPLWRQRYGSKLIELNRSPDTRWMYGL